ncbi:MAG TPA: DUF4349 domain-containing protein [Bacillales bacterium]|nr:DUF4349 domain-containing protein [Bacillales bacterium]
MKARIYCILIFCFAITLVFAGCQRGENSSSSSTDSGRSKGFSGAEIATDEAADQKSAAENGFASRDASMNKPPGVLSVVDAERMIIYTANLAVTVNDFDAADKQMRSLVSSYGGYVVHSFVSNSASGHPTGTITVRVPQPKFTDFLGQVEKLANEVVRKNVQGQDVTKQYVDLSARLKAQQEVKTRLESFLKEADNSEDLLNIFDHLANVQQQIEQLKGQINYLQNHAALATVTVSITESDTGLKPKEEWNTWNKTKQAFIDSLNMLMSFASSVIVFLVGYSPVLIILAALVILGLWLFRKLRRNKTPS